MDRAYKVYSIDNGTVIDHIPTPLALKVVEILGIGNEGIFTIGVGFQSKSLPEGKDIVKIENRILLESETDTIALIAPRATINIICNGKVSEKRKISVPETIRGVMTCPNPNCATNNLGAEKHFTLEDPSQVVYRCRYCERVTEVKPENLTAP
ncbi:aspartate carbamoyltransferase regulatory subunit [Candidatus Fermentibacteria bacterium]|nr:MAG: aspartate carbamoyltransferase regulatory subunit [Candidatus Fermentibacteria bacterium]